MPTTSSRNAAMDKYVQDSGGRVDNSGLADRLRAYLAKSKGSKVTQPVAGKATGNRTTPNKSGKTGAQQAKEWGDKKRMSQGRPVTDTAPAMRSAQNGRPRMVMRREPSSMPQSMSGSAAPAMPQRPVQGPLPQAQQGYTRPPNAIMPSAPVGSYGPPQTQVMGPAPRPQGYTPPSMFNQQPQGMPQSGYMPPFNPPYPQTDYQMRVNPWSRQW